MIKEKFLTIVLLTGSLVMVAGILAAGPVTGPPIFTPIDGGLSIVIAACAGYGAKKIRDSRKK